MRKVIILMMMLFFSTPILANNNAPEILSPDTLTWNKLPSYPTLKYAILAGNPYKHEFFVVRLHLPKDYADIVHQHSSARYDTVISGSYYLGFGRNADRSKTQKVAAGTFIECPARTKHYGFTDEETIIQISGIGPWEALKTAGPNR